MVQTTSTSLQHTEQTNSSASQQNRIPSPVTCSICSAGYAPSLSRQELWQASPDVVDAAFMSICHFCFRCRRPACPDCWDFVHGVCGACVQDAHLPFRTEEAPLEGTVFSPVRRLKKRQTTQDEQASSLFVCVQPGRFHTTPSPNLLSTQPLVRAKVDTTDTTNTANTANTADTTDAVEEVSGQRMEKPEAVISQSNGKRIVPAVQDEPRSVVMEDAEDVGDVGDVEAEAEQVAVKRGRRFLRVVEWLLTVTVLIVLLSVVALIVLAEFFPVVNEQVLRLVHIDIHAEIGYLWHLIQSLH